MNICLDAESRLRSCSAGSRQSATVPGEPSPREQSAAKDEEPLFADTADAAVAAHSAPAAERKAETSPPAQRADPPQRDVFMKPSGRKTPPASTDSAAPPASGASRPDTGRLKPKALDAIFDRAKQIKD